MRKSLATTSSRVAGCLAWTSGLGFGAPAVYGTAYFARHGDVWHFMGFPTYGDGPFEAIGIPTSVSLLTGFTIVCAAELVVGVLLWKRRRAGHWLSLALLPLEAAYWLGFALPFGPLLGAARTVAVVAVFRRHSAASSASTSALQTSVDRP